jgi:hypothetical protein
MLQAKISSNSSTKLTAALLSMARKAIAAPKNLTRTQNSLMAMPTGMQQMLLLPMMAPPLSSLLQLQQKQTHPFLLRKSSSRLRKTTKRRPSRRRKISPATSAAP